MVEPRAEAEEEEEEVRYATDDRFVRRFRELNADIELPPLNETEREWGKQSEQEGQGTESRGVSKQSGDNDRCEGRSTPRRWRCSPEGRTSRINNDELLAGGKDQTE